MINQLRKVIPPDRALLKALNFFENYGTKGPLKDNTLIKDNKLFYAQHGEDRLLIQCLAMIDCKCNKIACEIGAWDGEYLSNIAHLVKHCGWQGIFVESDNDKFNELKKNYFNQFLINFKATKDNINELIFKDQIDILSIDIDGDDYYLFKAMDFRPKIIVIEYNPTIPSHLDIVGKEGTRIGASVSALKRIASDKGYSLAFLTDTNLIFVLSDLMTWSSCEYTPTKYLEFIISDYDGNRMTIGQTCYGNNGQLNKDLLIIN